MSTNYYLMMYYVHSYLESVKSELKFDKNTTVENFRAVPENDAHCKKVFEYGLSQFNYELSHNQVCNGINLLLKSHFPDLKANDEVKFVEGDRSGQNATVLSFNNATKEARVKCVDGSETTVNMKNVKLIEPATV
jgi:hypothetical protein